MSTASIEGIVVVCKRGLVSMLRNVGSAGREISKEEGINHLAPSSIMLHLGAPSVCA